MNRVEVQIEEGQVLRLAAGVPEEPFAEPWRFWTSGDSAYLALRSLGSTFKASFHLANATHESAVWTHGFTSEAEQVFGDTGHRRSHMWQQEPEFMPGWYRGPGIAIPRLPDRKYNRPFVGDLSDVRWVDAPPVGSATILNVLLTDARPDLPPLQLGKGETLTSALPMRNGWHLVLHTSQRPLQDHERALVANVRDETRVPFPGPPRRGIASSSMLLVTMSLEGRPLFVEIVLGSDNFYEEPAARG